MEHVNITTEDGVELHGLYRSAENARAAVLLLHMMPSTKESWDAFADGLEKIGLSSLAIDERGHGESVMKNGEKIDYRDMDDQTEKKRDVEASVAWLAKKTGLPFSKIAVVGASIGANLAIRYAYDHPECPAAVSLSPGLDYRGVRTPDAVEGMAEGLPVFIAVSSEDSASAASVHELESLETAANVETVILEGAGHGTTMFEHDHAFMDASIEWLSKRL